MYIYIYIYIYIGKKYVQAFNNLFFDQQFLSTRISDD